MRVVLSALVVGLLAVPSAASAQARTWSPTEDTTVRFVCQGEQTRNAARGRFASVAGTVTADPTTLVGSRGRIQIELVSITTWDAAWDAMFRRAPFLEIEEHPHAYFELRSVRGATALEPGEWARMRLHGALTVRGVEREVVIPARARWRPAGDEPEEIELRARFPIAWEDYGIAVPRGWARSSTGDRAAVEVRLHLRPRPGGAG